MNLIPVYDRQIELGEPVDLFHAFAPHGDRTLCFFRRHVLGPHTGSGASALWMAEWDGRQLTSERELLLGGEDPRVCVHDGQVYVFVYSYAMGGRYMIYVYPSEELIDVELPPGLLPGKNWQPVSVDGRLRVVHSFSPLRWLDIDPSTGATSLISEQPVGLDQLAPHDHYTIYRGGSNALGHDGAVQGTGHITYVPHRHAPFLWTFNGHLTIQPLDVPLLTGQFGVVDPTSLWRDPSGQRWLSLGCSERDWFSAQRFATYIVEAPEWPA